MEEKIYPLYEDDSDALVICCSDWHFYASAVVPFVREELGVHHPTPIIIPGSIASFGTRMFLTMRWETLREHIALLAHHGKHPRVIIINHDECKGYGAVANWIGGHHKIPAAQCDHAKELAGLIRKEYLPNAEFELYQAHIVPNPSGDGRGVQFVKVL